MENAIASDARSALMEPGQSTVPWAAAWLTWPMMFIGNIGVALHAIARHWDTSIVLTALLLANVAVLIALECGMDAADLRISFDRKINRDGARAAANGYLRL